jgi:CRP/FNR family cyclic AMP-dependent transcriptional regulator
MPLFNDLSSDELSRLDRVLRQRTFRAGTNIITVEQPGEVVYIIQTGTVKVHVEQADGKDVTLAILGPGEVVGEMGTVEGVERSASAETLEETSVLWLDRATFQQFLLSMPQLAYNLLRIMSRRLRLANTHIQSLAALDVYGRLARQLLSLAREYGEKAPDGSLTIPIRLTQSDLADLVGASRVRVNQVLVDYKERNFISESSNHRFTVHDVEALARRCQ